MHLWSQNSDPHPSLSHTGLWSITPHPAEPDDVVTSIPNIFLLYPSPMTPYLPIPSMPSQLPLSEWLLQSGVCVHCVSPPQPSPLAVIKVITAHEMPILLIPLWARSFHSTLGILHCILLDFKTWLMASHWFPNSRFSLQGKTVTEEMNCLQNSAVQSVLQCFCSFKSGISGFILVINDYAREAYLGQGHMESRAEPWMCAPVNRSMVLFCNHRSMGYCHPEETDGKNGKM
jgi:hypothetical protein